MLGPVGRPFPLFCLQANVKAYLRAVRDPPPKHTGHCLTSSGLRIPASMWLRPSVLLQPFIASAISLRFQEARPWLQFLVGLFLKRQKQGQKVLGSLSALDFQKNGRSFLQPQLETLTQSKRLQSPEPSLSQSIMGEAAGESRTC